MNETLKIYWPLHFTFSDQYWYWRISLNCNSYIIGWSEPEFLCRSLIWLQILITNKTVTHWKPKLLLFSVSPCHPLWHSDLCSILALNETRCHPQYRACSHKLVSRPHCHIVDSLIFGISDRINLTFLGHMWPQFCYRPYWSGPIWLKGHVGLTDHNGLEQYHSEHEESLQWANFRFEWYIFRLMHYLKKSNRKDCYHRNIVSIQAG